MLVSRSAEQGDGRAEELLLKMHLLTNLLNGKFYPFRSNDPLILNIIFSLDDCDYSINVDPDGICICAENEKIPLSSGIFCD